MTIKFDNLIEVPCAIEPPDSDILPDDGNGTDDGNDGDNGDDGDGDGDIWTLVLKPEYALREVGQNVQYRTYLVNQFGNEKEVTQGLIYRSSNPSIAIIGALGGKASCLADGIATVSVEWQDLMAFAQIEVVSTCADVKVGMVVLIDDSKSMSQPFSESPVPAGQTAYATRLSYAKELSSAFLEDLNTYKDLAAVMSFTTGSVLKQALTNDVQDLKDAVQSVNPTIMKTGIDQALKGAWDLLKTAKSTGQIDKQAIIILTDGENSDGINPLPYADQIFGEGGIVVGVGMRAHSIGFHTVRAICVEGGFINALPSNTDTTESNLIGMKGYFCAGNCKPAGGVTIGVPQLDYAAFANWDVTNKVDLIGGFPPNELYDFLPGNGLYVDLVGSSEPFLGTITSKIAFAVTAGKTYKLSYRLAGNQRTSNDSYDEVRVRFTNPEGSIDVTHKLDWLTPFTLFEHEFVAPSTNSGNIVFQQVNALGSGASAYGNLLDSVTLENVTDGITMLSDSFDGENTVTIDPPCPPGEDWGIDWEECYGYGCLTEPLPEQTEDPDPLPVVEPINTYVGG